MNYFGGMRVVVSQMAETQKVWHTVERNPIRKRRKQWRVQRHERRDPCAYKLGDHTLVVHPVIAEQLARLAA